MDELIDGWMDGGMSFEDFLLILCPSFCVLVGDDVAIVVFVAKTT